MFFKKRLTTSLVVSVIALIASITTPIVPCRIAPSVPNPTYQWSLCTLNPDRATQITWINQYFGYTTSLTDAYFLVLLLSFVLTMFVLGLLNPRRRS